MATGQLGGVGDERQAGESAGGQHEPGHDEPALRRTGGPAGGSSPPARARVKNPIPAKANAAVSCLPLHATEQEQRECSLERREGEHGKKADQDQAADRREAESCR